MLFKKGTSEQGLANSMMALRLFMTLCFLVIAAVAAEIRPASAQLPLAVEVGEYKDSRNFERRGYGILVRYRGDCLLVTLAHIITLNGIDVELKPVTARWDEAAVSTVEYVFDDRERDIYLGRINIKDSLYEKCAETEEIYELYKSFDTQLQGLLNDEFNEIKMHIPPNSIGLKPEKMDTLLEVLDKNQPIRYRLDHCIRNINTCREPTKKDSGSLVSLSKGNGERLFLGLHQGLCDKFCSKTERIWQAISVSNIISIFRAPKFPLPWPGDIRLQDKESAKAESQEALPAIQNLVKSLQDELTRLNCRPGESDGIWGPRSQNALQRYAAAYKRKLPGTDPTAALYETLKSDQPQDCPSICSPGEILKDGVCRQAEKPKTDTLKQKTYTPPSNEVTNGCIRINGKLAC